MVIFAEGKFRKYVGKTLSVGVVFMIFCFLHKVIWVLFSHGGNFALTEIS